MISLDIDLSYLSRYLNISTYSMQRYQNKSVTEIVEMEAQKGNTRAAEFLLRLTTNPEELSKVFQLINPKNRYLILKNMNKEDLMKVMENLETEQFVLGLSMLNQEALVKLMTYLPPESLAKVVLANMDVNKFVKVIPEEYLDEFLTSDKIDKNMIMKAMKDIDDEQLQKMMENYTGQPCYDEPDVILQKMSEMSDDDFMKAVSSFEPEGKQQLVVNLIKNKPDLFEEFSVDAMTHPFKSMQKEDILKSLTVLEPKEFMPMMEELPQEIMAIIATQIDPRVFAQILTSEFSDIIAECGIDFS